MNPLFRLCCIFLLLGFASSLKATPPNQEEGKGQGERQEDLLEQQIQTEVQYLRQQSDINIVLDYNEPFQWNPLFSYTASEAQVHIALFEGLLSYDPVDMTPRPGLAKSWDRSEDGKRYTFYLRKDARFSNGAFIDANTVVQTWFYMIRAGNRAPFSSLLDLVTGVKEYRAGLLSQSATGIQVPNPYQIELTLEHPSPEILAILCHHSLSPLPPSLLVEQDWEGLYRKLGDPGSAVQLISNGPYHLKQSTASGIVLEPNPYYWNRSAVESEEIFIQKYYEWQDMDISAALNSYKIDWVASSFSDFRGLRRSPELIHIGKSFSTTFFYFANTANPTNSWSLPEVRQALTLLLPLQELRSGLGGDAYLIPKIPGFTSGESLKKQDAEEAMNLLEKAGYPKGEGLGTLTLYFPEGSTYENFARLITDAWSKLKCDVTVEYGDATARITAGKNEQETSFTLEILSWVGDYPDPTTFLNLWLSSSSLNIFGYSDPVYDAMLSRAQQSMDRKQRLDLLSEAEEYLLQNGSVIPLWHSPSFNLYDKRFLGGFYQNVLDLHPLQTLRRIYRLPKGSA